MPAVSRAEPSFASASDASPTSRERPPVAELAVRPSASAVGRGGGRVAALAAGAIALAVYLATLAPGLTWAHDGADGGDFLAAALTGGVPHPTGYPTYQILLRAAVSLWPANPALAGNMLSALSAALAVALLASLSADLLAPSPWRRSIAVICSLSWAFAPSLWSQAIITEAYALNALFVMVVLWLLRRADVEPAPRRVLPWLGGVGLALGVGIGNHLTLLLAAPVILTFFGRARGAQRPPLYQQIAAVAVPALLGSLVYLYLPIAARSGPPINWGNPSSVEGFWEVISGQIYRGLLFGVDSRMLPARIAGWVASLLEQFGGAWGAVLALIGLWQLDRNRHQWWRATGLLALLYSIYAIGYDTADSYVYLIPAWGVTALWLGQGMHALVAFLSDLWHRRISARWPDGLRSGLIWATVGVLFLLHPGVSLARNWSRISLRSDRQAVDFYETVLEQAPPGSVLLTATDRSTFALWYAIYGLRLRQDLVPINASLYNYGWYRSTLGRSHPALAAGAERTPDLPLLGDLLLEVSSSRAIFRAEDMSIRFEGFDEVPAGDLVRLVRK